MNSAAIGAADCGACFPTNARRFLRHFMGDSGRCVSAKTSDSMGLVRRSAAASAIQSSSWIHRGALHRTVREVQRHGAIRAVMLRSAVTCDTLPPCCRFRQITQLGASLVLIVMADQLGKSVGDMYSALVHSSPDRPLRRVPFVEHLTGPITTGRARERADVAGLADGRKCMREAFPRPC